MKVKPEAATAVMELLVFMVRRVMTGPTTNTARLSP
jgi:hypothetical protein